MTAVRQVCGDCCFYMTWYDLSKSAFYETETASPDETASQPDETVSEVLHSHDINTNTNCNCKTSTLILNVGKWLRIWCTIDQF